MFRIYDNYDTTLTVAYNAGTDTLFRIDSLSDTLPTTFGEELAFTITSGANSCIVTAHVADSDTGYVEFEVESLSGTEVEYPIGATVSLLNSVTSVVNSQSIPKPAMWVEPGLFSSPYGAYASGSISHAYVDQSSEGSHVDINIIGLFDTGLISDVVPTRIQTPITSLFAPKTFYMFLRQNLSGGDYDGTIAVSYNGSNYSLTPTGTGPTTVAPIKCLKVTAIGIPSDTAFVIAEWVTAESIDISP